MDRLMPLASELGSDVPFFLYGQSAVMSGRGEHIKPLTLPWQGWILLIMPPMSVSTAAVYRLWRPLPQENSIQELQITEADNTIEWMENTFNMLEKPAMQVCPQLRTVIEMSEKMIGRPVRLSGSGSTLFTAFDDKDQADYYTSKIGDELKLNTCVVQPVEQSAVTLGSQIGK